MDLMCEIFLQQEEATPQQYKEMMFGNKFGLDFKCLENHLTNRRPACGGTNGKMTRVQTLEVMSMGPVVTDYLGEPDLKLSDEDQIIG